MPVDLPTLAAFALTAAAIVISPGPDTMLILRYGLTSGQRSALAAVGGVQVGLLVHTLVAATGLSVLIAASPTLFRAVAVAGAAYLAWLGLQGLLGPSASGLDGRGSPASAAKACRDAVLTNLLNPKVIVLFVALYPNFVVAGRGDVPAQLVTLSVVLIAINLIWQAPLAWAAEHIRRWLVRPRVQLLVSRLTGAILLSFAAAMLIEHVLTD